MPASHRSCIREAGVMSVFERLFRGEGDLTVMYLQHIRLFDLPGYDAEFAEGLIQALKTHEEEIQKLILTSAPAWPWKNIHFLDRAILMTAVAELVYMRDTPTKIVINEYVEIAKQYGGEGTRKFVNGVMGAVYIATRKEGVDAAEKAASEEYTIPSL